MINVNISKWMSWALRHQPQRAGITLDDEGWTDLDALVTACQKKFPAVTVALIDEVVATDNKGRYQIEGSRIRAVQGHSVNVNTVGDPVEPLMALYHGTTRSAWKKIQADGKIRPMSRQHVHLSKDPVTAIEVGDRRHEETVVLEIHTSGMTQPFYCAENGVWLTGPISVEDFVVEWQR